MAVVALDNMLAAYYEGKQIALHRISYQRKDMVVNPQHYRRLTVKQTMDPILVGRVKNETMTEENALACLATYLGQIEIMDGQIGEVRKAVFACAARDGRPAVFGYTSDHGDACGENRLYGKRTYFETSAKVPLLLEGDKIAAGRVITSPVSLMDVGPTICELAGTTFEIGDGHSLANQLGGKMSEEIDRVVMSQMVDQTQDGEVASVMLRWREYKYVCYNTNPRCEFLVNLEQDPKEQRNILAEQPVLAAWFAQRIAEDIDFFAMEQTQRNHTRNVEWFRAHETIVGLDDSERWQDNPPTARGNLSITAVDRMG